MQAKLRIGVLGTARISQIALLGPSRRIPDIEVTTIASRDPARAAKYARRHKIPRVLDSYDSLLHDPLIDAVYVPLPNSLHLEWTEKALRAGKHVLCEKPIACNAAEAERIAMVARETGRTVVEAMHFRFHPLAFRIREILASGVLGRIRHIEAACCVPLLKRDFRYNFAFGGGATMDLGCYAVSFVRLAAGSEPDVVDAQARLASPQVDRWMRARLEFSGGIEGEVRSSMWSAELLRGDACITGDEGTLTVKNPYAPQLFNQLILETGGKRLKERLKGYESSYYYQLKAFARAIQLGEPISPGIEDAVANMRVIDAIYRQAGLSVRGSSPSPATA